MNVANFFASGGPLASVVGDGYRHRPEQVRLADEVRTTFRDGGALLADAPTGTGKSFGYLVPAVLSGKKVVVSTATKALQAQLVGKDLPMLREAMERAGYEAPRFALLKGRGDFLCDRRFDEYADHATLEELDVMDKVEAWRSTTMTGDKEHLPLPIPRFWKDVAADADDCHRQSCLFAETCHYFTHKDRALGADILVVNHALLLANIASDGGAFGMEGRHLVLDEAHVLEKYISEAFGASVSRHRVYYVCNALERKAEDIGRFTARVRGYAESFFEELKSYTTLGAQDDTPPSYRELLKALVSVQELVRNNPREEVNKLSGMVGRLKGDLASFYEPLKDTHAYDIVVQPSSRGKLGMPILQSWLVDPAEVFSREVLQRSESAATVLTSATLAVGRSFAYPKGRLGFDRFDGSVRELQGREIFDYERNSLVYVEKNLVPPVYENADLFLDQSVRRAAELVETSSGRALILLSTWKALKRFRDGFDELVEPYPVKFQGDESTSRLITWLKTTPGAVLVGTRTFWEGVDVPGEALSLVVIDKVPFPPPDDPVIKKLCEKAGSRWFSEVSLPRAQMSLQQGGGRLIRTHDDRGVIAILDSRICRKPWGHAVLACLPDGAPVATSLGDVRAFFSENDEAA